MFRKLTPAERDTLTAKLNHASDQLFAEGDMLNRATPAAWATYGVPGPSVFYQAAAEASTLVIDVLEAGEDLRTCVPADGPPEYDPEWATTLASGVLDDDGEAQRIAEVYADAKAELDAARELPWLGDMDRRDDDDVEFCVEGENV